MVTGHADKWARRTHPGQELVEPQLTSRRLALDPTEISFVPENVIPETITPVPGVPRVSG